MMAIRTGIVVTAALAVGGVFVIGIIDAILGARDRPTIGERLLKWTRKAPWFAAATSLVLGILITHFFWPN